MLAGVDGYKNGWVAAVDFEDGSTRVKTYPNFGALLEDRSLTLIVVDIPIGLPEEGARRCDREARRFLRQGRGSCVFPAPIRAMLKANDWGEACQARMEREGKKCSMQVVAIIPKIREANEAMTPELQLRVREGHPEVSFAMMNEERPMRSRKMTKQGKLDRIQLLVGSFPDLAAHLRTVPGASSDILDAYACLWTARRIGAMRARIFPHEREQDSAGMNMEIVA